MNGTARAAILAGLLPLAAWSGFAATPLHGQHMASLDEAPCELQAIERYRFGSADGPDALSVIGGAFLVPRGRETMVYVLLPQERLVRGFTQRGKPAVRVGGAGAGPGEFEAPATAGIAGEELWVWDVARGRLSYFDRDGRFLRSLALGYGGRAFPFGDGSLARYPRITDPTAAGDIVIQRLDGEDGSLLDTLAVVPFQGPGLRIRSGNVARSAPQPFSDDPLFARSSAGGAFAVVHRRIEERDRGPAMSIHLMRPGAGTDTLNILVEPERLAPAEADSVIRKMSSDLIEGARARGVPIDERDFSPSALADEVRVPRWHPAARRAFLDHDDRLWIEATRRAPGETTTWTVLAPGEETCRVEMPADWTLRDVAGGVGAASTRGASDIPQVIVLELSR